MMIFIFQLISSVYRHNFFLICQYFCLSAPLSVHRLFYKYSCKVVHSDVTHTLLNLSNLFRPISGTIKPNHFFMIIIFLVLRSKFSLSSLVHSTMPVPDIRNSTFQILMPETKFPSFSLNLQSFSVYRIYTCHWETCSYAELPLLDFPLESSKSRQISSHWESEPMTIWW